MPRSDRANAERVYLRRHAFRSLILLGVAALLALSAAGLESRRETLTVREVTQPALAVSADGRTLYFQVLGDLVSLPVDGGKGQQLTSGPSYDSWPALSADERWLYFLSDRDGLVQELYRLNLQDPGAGSPATAVERLTDLGLDLRELAVAPDGASFAAVAGSRRGRFLYRQLPGGQRDVINGAHPALRRPSFIANDALVLLDRSNRAGVLQRASPQGQETVYQPAAGRSILWAVVDPTGRYAVVSETGDWRQREPSWQETLLIELSAQRVIYRTPSRPYRAYSVSEERAAISAESAFLPFDGGIVKVHLETGASARLGWEVEVVRQVPIRADQPGKSWNRIEGAEEVFGQTEVRPSPSGDAVVFALAGDLFLMQRGGVPAPLTRGPQDDSFPSFDPTGERIFFARDGELQALALDDGTVAPLAIDVSADALDYFQVDDEGKRATILGSVRASMVGEVDLENGVQTTRVEPKGRWITFPAYGQGGEILFVASREGGPQVYSSFSQQEAEPRALTALSRPPIRVAGSPDGRFLAFLRDGKAWRAPRGTGVITEEDVHPIGKPGAHSIAFDASGDRLWVGRGSAVEVYDVARGRHLESWDLRVREDRPRLPPPLVIRQVNIVDLDSGAVQRGMRVELAAGRIARILPELEAAPPAAGVQVIDGAGLFLIPGLFDMHCHDVGDGLTALLAYGITTVRELGTIWPFQRALREAVRSGRRPGPNIISAAEIFEGGRPIWGNGPSHHIDSVEEGLETLRQRVEEGVDLLKFYPTLPRRLRAPLVTAAVARGVPTATHVATLRDLVTVLDDGGGGLEHFPDHVPVLYGDLLALFAAHEVVWTPTLSVRGLGDLKWRSQVAELQEPLFQRAVPEAHLRAWAKRQKVGPTSEENLVQLVAERSANVVRAIEAGVTVVVGSDCSRGNALIGPSTHWEIEALVEGGLSNHRALAAATQIPAQASGLVDRGLVRAHAWADLLLLTGNPLEDIRNTRRIAWVIRQGEPLQPQALITGDAAASTPLP